MTHFGPGQRLGAGIPAQATGGEQLSLADLLHDELVVVGAGVEWFEERVRERLIGQSAVMDVLTEAYIGVLQAPAKRVRGSLTVIGHDMAGGDNEELAAHAAGIVEGIQATLLVMDDVSDRSPTRRGRPTAHVAIEAGLRRLGSSTEDLGAKAMDMAVNGAFGVQVLTQLLVGGLAVPAERRLMVGGLMNETLLDTGNGQMMDVFSTTGVPLSEAEILRVARDKTAYYTFDFPLAFGVLLASGDTRYLPLIKQYGENTGIAFQLADDVMGVFGDPKKMGKSAMSDLQEGKQTLLVFRALQLATDTQRSMLLAALGNPGITEAQFAACQEIIEQTGAREYVEALAREHSSRAHDVLAGVPETWKPGRVAQLHGLAQFVVARSA